MRTSMLATVLTLALCGPALAEARIIVVQDTPPPPAAESPQAMPAEPPSSEAQPVAPPPASPAPTAAAPQAPAPQAAAPTPPAPSSSSRFRFERASEGYLRLDYENGQIAFCAPRSAGWTCQAVPEDRAALEKEIARLQDEVASLRREVATLREPPPPPRPPADLAPPPLTPKGGDKSGDLTIKLPTQNDIDRATAALQRAWDRVVDMIGNLTKDLSRKPPHADRTTL